LERDERAAAAALLPPTRDQVYERIQSEGTKTNPWVQFGMAVRRLVYNPKFGLAMNLVIVTAGILVGIATYPGMEESPALQVMDFMILVMFSVEIILKLLSDPLKPWDFFIGENWAWNNFDLIIVMACMPFLPLGGAAAVLRLMRLMRILKLFKSSRELQTILVGLGVGLSSSCYIFLLIFLVFYMFAVFGVMMFKEGDSVEFRGLGTAFHTLFRIATFEDWTDVMYINYYGCDKYPSGGGVVYSTNATIAANNPAISNCEAGNKAPVISIFFFHLFVLISALILLSMFVGAMAIAMIETMQEMNEQKDNSKEEEDAIKADRDPHLDLLDMVTPFKRTRDRHRAHKIGKAFTKALGGKFEDKFVKIELDKCAGNPLILGYVMLGCKARSVANSNLFSNFIALVIVFAGVLVGMQTDGKIEENFHVEWAITGIFAFEAVVKIMGELTDPLQYFDDGWNRFDFTIVAVSIIPIKVGGAAVIMRLLRLLRVLKLLRAFPKLQIIVSTVMASFNSIFYIGILLFGCFYIFGVAACIFFAANDPWHFGNLHLALFSLFRVASMEDWTDIMYINSQGCNAFATFPYDVYPELCTKPEAWMAFSIIFFSFFLFLNGIILLTLFIGIISAEMENTAALDTECKQEDYKVRRYIRHLARKNKPIPTKELRAYSRMFELLQEVKGRGNHRCVVLDELNSIFQLVDNSCDLSALKAQFEAIDEGTKGFLLYSEFVRFMHMCAWTDKGDTLDDMNEQFNKRQVQFLDPRVVMMFEPSGMLGQLGYGHEGENAKSSMSNMTRNKAHQDANIPEIVAAEEAMAEDEERERLSTSARRSNQDEEGRPSNDAMDGRGQEDHRGMANFFSGNDEGREKDLNAGETSGMTKKLIEQFQKKEEVRAATLSFCS
jgi:voltage-gated sodium channel